MEWRSYCGTTAPIADFALTAANAQTLSAPLRLCFYLR